MEGASIVSRLHWGSLLIGAAIVFVGQWFLSRNKARA